MDVDYLNALLDRGRAMLITGQEVLELVLAEIERIKGHLTEDEHSELMAAVKNAQRGQIEAEESINKGSKEVTQFEGITEADFNTLHEKIVCLQDTYREKQAHINTLNAWVSQCKVTAQKRVDDLYSRIEEQVSVGESVLDEIEKLVRNRQTLVTEHLLATNRQQSSKTNISSPANIENPNTAFTSDVLFSSTLNSQHRQSSGSLGDANSPIDDDRVRSVIVGCVQPPNPTIEVDGPVDNGHCRPLLTNSMSDALTAGDRVNRHLFVPSAKLHDHSAESGVSLSSTRSPADLPKEVYH